MQLELTRSIGLYKASVDLRNRDGKFIRSFSATSQVNETKCEQSAFRQCMQFLLQAKMYFDEGDTWLDRYQKELIDEHFSLEEIEEAIEKLRPLIKEKQPENEKIVL